MNRNTMNAETADTILENHPTGRITKPGAQDIHVTWTTNTIGEYSEKITLKLLVGAPARSQEQGETPLPLCGVPAEIYDVDKLWGIPDPVCVEELVVTGDKRRQLALLIEHPELIEDIEPIFYEAAHTVAQARQSKGEFFGLTDSPKGRVLRDTVINALSAKAERARVLDTLLRHVSVTVTSLSIDSENEARQLFPELF